jgi:ribosomal protein S18 acetylase RimI-like enzyme
MLSAQGGSMALQSIEIVPRVDADLRRLFGLVEATFAALPGWNEQRVLDALARDVVFVAREDDQPAGYVALRGDGAAVVVEQLFVAPGHERRGIGRRLLAHAEGYAIAERARALRIVVESDNLVARGFYRRSGFVPVDTELFELVLPLPD